MTAPKQSTPYSTPIISCTFPVPLAVVEITPLTNLLSFDEGKREDGDDCIVDYSLSSELAKIQLKKMCLHSQQMLLHITIPSRKESTSHQEVDHANVPEQKFGNLHDFSQSSNPSTLYSGVLTVSSKDELKQKQSQIGQENNFVYLFPDDPTLNVPIPCRINGHVLLRNHQMQGSFTKEQQQQEQNEIVMVTMTEGTHVRVCSQQTELPFVPKRSRSTKTDIHSFLEESFLHNYSSSIEQTSMNETNSNSLLNPNGSLQLENEKVDKEVLSNHDPELIRALALRMRLLLHTTHYISTSSDRFENDTSSKKNYPSQSMLRTVTRFHNRRRSRKKLKQSKESSTNDNQLSQNKKNEVIQSHSNTEQMKEDVISGGDKFPKSLSPGKSTPSSSSSMLSQIVEEGGLTVYNSHNSSGKTSLVTSIARHVLHCPNIHILNPGYLFAKYGVNYADAALEGILYDLVMGAAVNTKTTAVDSSKAEKKNKSTHDNDIQSEIENENHVENIKCEKNSVCIILDGLDGFVGWKDTGKNGETRMDKGDPSIVTLNSIAAYLANLTNNLRNKRRFPYPSKNAILHSLTQSNGYKLPVHLCLIGIVTFPNGYTTNTNSISPILDTLGGRFYLSSPSAITRAIAFQRTLTNADFSIHDEEIQSEIEHLAVSAVNARGLFFTNVVKKLKTIINRDHKRINDDETIPCPSIDQLREAFITSASSSAVTPTFNRRPKERGNKTSESSNRKNESEKKSTPFLYTVNVGGNMEAKIALENALALNPLLRKALAKFQLSPPTGVLLYGPPGTGKTLLARATAESLQRLHRKQIGSNSPGQLGGKGAFISLQASQVVRAEVGNSEKVVVSAFEMARANAPAVIFIDEFQALFTERGKGSGRLATTLLQCMDDVTAWRDADLQISQWDDKNERSPEPGDMNERVVVLGATNTPWMIDTAFLRPGRFDRVVHVGLPDFEERRSILKVHLRKMRIYPPGESSVDRIALAMSALCKGFSGADLGALCRAAAVRCLSENRVGTETSAEGIDLCKEEAYVKDRHFQEARTFDVQNSSEVLLVEKLAKWRP